MPQQTLSFMTTRLVLLAIETCYSPRGTHGVEHNGINVILEKGLDMQVDFFLPKHCQSVASSQTRNCKNCLVLQVFFHISHLLHRLFGLHEKQNLGRFNSHKMRENIYCLRVPKPLAVPTEDIHCDRRGCIATSTVGYNDFMLPAKILSLFLLVSSISESPSGLSLCARFLLGKLCLIGESSTISVCVLRVIFSPFLNFTESCGVSNSLVVSRVPLTKTCVCQPLTTYQILLQLHN